MAQFRICPTCTAVCLETVIKLANLPIVVVIKSGVKDVGTEVLACKVVPCSVEVPLDEDLTLDAEEILKVVIPVAVEDFLVKSLELNTENIKFHVYQNCFEYCLLTKSFFQIYFFNVYKINIIYSKIIF